MMKIKMVKKLYSVAVGCVVSLVFPNTLLFAVEATGAGTITRQLEQSEQYREQKENIEKGQQETPEIDVDELLNSDEKVSNASVTFQLNNIEVSKSDILTEKELDLIFQSYIGRIITLNDLNKLLDEINALYKLKGYLAAKALLPPQKISEGSVKIRLIEGRVGALEIEGNNSTNDDYILDNLVLSSGDLVDIKTLQKNLEKINLLTDIQLGIALKPGEEIGKTDYLLNVREPKRQEAFVYMDNAGTDDVGLYRVGFNYIDRSLTGNRDLLTIGGYAATGTKAFYTSYKFPVNRLGTVVNLSGNISKIDIIDGPIKPLDISGDSYALRADVSHPFMIAEDGFVTATLGINKKQSSTDSSSVTLFETDVNTVDFGIKRQSFLPDSISYASIRGTITPSGRDNETSFFKINADFSYYKQLQNDWLALLRLGGQWSDTKLLPSTEQFQIGGIYTVRGYTEGLLIGYKGYYSSIELSHPLPKTLTTIFGNNARYLLFLDHGAAIAFKGNGEGSDRDDFLTSVGVGLDFQLSKVVSAHITAGKPLIHREDENDSGRVNFNLQARF
jgi:hemolysin activation/secretion protein